MWDGGSPLHSLGGLDRTLRMSDEHPNIGDPLEPLEKTTQMARLREITRPFLSTAISDAAPIACRVNGVETPFKDFPDLLPGHTAILACFENYDYVARTTWAAFVHFFENRAPWEDFDVCVFSDIGEWCVAINHNGHACLVGDRNLANPSCNTDALTRAG